CKSARPRRFPSAATAIPPSTAAPPPSFSRTPPPTSRGRRSRSTAARSEASSDGSEPMSLMRSVLLAASNSRFLRERATSVGFIRAAVKKFMPGEDAPSALDAAKALGDGAVLTRLGENLASAREADDVAAHYLGVLDKIHAGKLDVEISVKPTQLGLDFSREDCQRHLDALLERAKSQNNWVWVD